ncbi:DUF3866 family protein [Trueperella pecoris]|uniref:DUF3866 family protein n=1 Tax=Trueperella pecoris TaxID=2733571 RepID=A0A7M1QX80_9ACTO|nr:DUF3866 family protein [Trueperella pecoris]QOQ39866.1 DUF3866 family protein [Trueperella pecoris]QOR46640.1 DUF3866 family protein [Trueperella pecoris]
MKWREAHILRERNAWANAAEYEAELEGQIVRALAYIPQVGRPEPGDRALVTSATHARGLGTGGYVMIVALPDRLPADDDATAGHIVKARYTPLQYMVMGVDEQDSPYHGLLQDADSIDAMPVIGADLHSALPAIVAGVHAVSPGATIAYVMSDGGALPAWFSQTAAALKDKGHILGTISAGQAYGGDLEAVNVHTALLAARLVWNADIAIVTQGPGNLGTDTRWGFSGTSIGEALNAAHVLGGRPIAALRASQADARPRHLGISHHTMTVLEKVVHVPCTVVTPEIATVAEDVRAQMSGQLIELAQHENLTLVDYPTAALVSSLRNPPAPLRTMGRTFDEDPLSFLATAAAGAYAGGLVDNEPSHPIR